MQARGSGEASCRPVLAAVEGAAVWVSTPLMPLPSLPHTAAGGGIGGGAEGASLGGASAARWRGRGLQCCSAPRRRPCIPARPLPALPPQALCNQSNLHSFLHVTRHRGLEAALWPLWHLAGEAGALAGQLAAMGRLGVSHQVRGAMVWFGAGQRRGDDGLLLRSQLHGSRGLQCTRTAPRTPHQLPAHPLHSAGHQAGEPHGEQPAFLALLWAADRGADRPRSRPRPCCRLGRRHARAARPSARRPASRPPRPRLCQAQVNIPAPGGFPSLYLGDLNGAQVGPVWAGLPPQLMIPTDAVAGAERRPAVAGGTAGCGRAWDGRHARLMPSACLPAISRPQWTQLTLGGGYWMGTVRGAAAATLACCDHSVARRQPGLARARCASGAGRASRLVTTQLCHPRLCHPRLAPSPPQVGFMPLRIRRLYVGLQVRASACQRLSASLARSLASCATSATGRGWQGPLHAARSAQPAVLRCASAVRPAPCLPQGPGEHNYDCYQARLLGLVLPCRTLRCRQRRCPPPGPLARPPVGQLTSALNPLRHVPGWPHPPARLEQMGKVLLRLLLQRCNERVDYPRAQGGVRALLAACRGPARQPPAQADALLPMAVLPGSCAWLLARVRTACSGVPHGPPQLEGMAEEDAAVRGGALALLAPGRAAPNGQPPMELWAPGVVVGLLVRLRCGVRAGRGRAGRGWAGVGGRWEGGVQ